MVRFPFNHSLLMIMGLAGMLGCGGNGTAGAGGAATGSGSTSGAGMGGNIASSSSGTPASSSGTPASSSSTTGSSSTSSSSGMASTTSSGSGMGGAGGMASSSMTTSSSGVDPGDLDQDGDGWTPNQGDCCDVPGNCANPELVNPGAYEYPGNGVDDDCDPATPDGIPVPDCSPAALMGIASSDDLIKAMDLCQFTTESPPLPMKKWGVISTQILLADGTPFPNPGGPNNVQWGVLAQYGPNVLPQKGGTMAAISSGTARAVGDPGYVHPQNGTVGQIGNFNAGTQAGIPASYLAAHGGKVPSPVNCPICNGMACGTAYDSVNLKARIRVPTNVKAFSYKFKFYTAEYPEFLCQVYNDFFVTLLKSAWVPPAMGVDGGAPPPPLPADGDIAFDAQNNPVSVNNGFFEVCFPSPPSLCPGGTAELVGTGMGGWGNNIKDGGGTEWLINDSPVVPGETIEIQFIIWDAGDHNVDSAVLLDKFRWSVTPSQVGVHK